jgi:hypothetical protein
MLLFFSRKTASSWNWSTWRDGYWLVKPVLVPLIAELLRPRCTLYWFIEWNHTCGMKCGY